MTCCLEWAGFGRDAGQRAVCLQSESEWTAAEFADMPDVLHKPTGAENIPSAYTVCVCVCV